MDTVSFQTPGLIDPRCISTIGVSVKETENPIGFFGTGLKYAIAIILRSGGEITVWRGLEPLRFASVEQVIRGRPIQIVTMNGQELGFTTDLGKHWKMWQAFREVYCNTVDEHGATSSGMVDPEAYKTTIHVSLLEFADCFANISEYILTTKPIYTGPHSAFHQGPTSAVFYRTVRVADRITNKPFRFATNLVTRVDLTEDRTIKDTWMAHFLIARGILGCEDEAFITRWLSAGEDYAEHTLDIDFPSIEPTAAFLKIAAELAADTSRPCNITVPKVLARYRTQPKPIECALLPHERATLSESVAFCKRFEYTVDEFPIVIVESLGKNVLGLAQVESRRILLARRAIQMGGLTLAATLIEEWVHVKFEYEDCSREMQNWLFEQLTRMCKAYAYEQAVA